MYSRTNPGMMCGCHPTLEDDVCPKLPNPFPSCITYSWCLRLWSLTFVGQYSTLLGMLVCASKWKQWPSEKRSTNTIREWAFLCNISTYSFIKISCAYVRHVECVCLQMLASLQYEIEEMCMLTHFAVNSVFAELCFQPIVWCFWQDLVDAPGTAQTTQWLSEWVCSSIAELPLGVKGKGASEASRGLEVVACRVCTMVEQTR